MTTALAYEFAWGPVRDRLDLFLLGAWLNVWVTAISFVLACALGIGIALMRGSGIALLRAPAFAYVQILRGVPLLVFLYWVYFGVAIVVGLNFSAVQAGIVALSLTGPRTPPRSSGAGSTRSTWVRRRRRDPSASLASGPIGTSSCRR